MFDFKNKVVLITGGSRGIGSHAAKLFAAAGAQIIITYNSEKEAADRLLARLDGTHHSAYQLDLADDSAIEGFFSLVAENTLA